MAVLHTARLTLRPCHPGDRTDFMDLERDPEVMRYLNGGHAVENEAGDPNSPFLMPRGTETYVWTARRNANEAFVGWFCLWPADEICAELGYRLRRADWGQGLAAEGAAALVDWGFGSAGYERIMASAMATNHASRRVMEKIGMSYARAVGVGSPESASGDVEYEVKRSEWAAKQGPAAFA